MDGGGGAMPPSTPLIASDGMDEDRPLSLKSFNYDLHNELVDGVFQTPTTEDFDFSEKGWWHMIAFQAKQLQLNKSLLDEAIEPYETTLAISRVNDSMEARGISYEDKDALLEVCEEIVQELALEVNAKDIFTIMIDVEVMETYSNTEYMEQEEETS